MEALRVKTTFVFLNILNHSPAEPGYALPLQTVDPDQWAHWSEYKLFVIQYVNLYQQSGLSNLIGRQLEMGVVS